VTTTLAQGTFTDLKPDFVFFVGFRVTFAGEVRATVDWTFATTDMDIAIARGMNPCVDAQGFIDFSVCEVVALQTGADKPERITAQLGPGEYTLYAENTGDDVEALSYQVLLTYTPSAGTPGTSLSDLPTPATQPGSARKAQRD
jgi:hypothetical protein